MGISLKVNGRVHIVDAPPDTPLLWILRDELGLTGAKYGCGTGDCGSCMVLIAGQPHPSCQWRLSRVPRGGVVTIEGIEGPVAEAVRTAWRHIDLAECGYCQSGQIITAIALLSATPRPSDRQIDLAFNSTICRCACYLGIRRAVYYAADLIK